MKVSVIFLMFLFSTSDMSCAAATQTVWAGSHLCPNPHPQLRKPLTLGFLSLPQLLSSAHATMSRTGTCAVLAEQGRELSLLYMEPKMFAFSFLKPSSAGHSCHPVAHLLCSYQPLFS